MSGTDQRAEAARWFVKADEDVRCARLMIADHPAQDVHDALGALQTLRRLLVDLV
jgi:hypothetical protein